MKLEVRVLGMPEFEAMAKRIPELLTEALPAAVFAGVQPFYAAAHANVPKKPTGDLAAAMKVVMAPSDEAELGGFLGALVGPKGKATAGIAFDDKGWYWRLVEFGHAVVRKGGATAAHRLKTVKAKRAAGYGFVPAHPFLRLAFDTSQDAATSVVAARLRASLEKYAPK